MVNREEAIKILKDLEDVDNSTPIPNKLFYEAFDMAIEALSVETVQIIQCKDCRWYEDPDKKIFENCVRGGRIIPMQPTDYCSYGKWRE